MANMTYETLMAEINKLAAQAEKLRAEEGVIQEIKEKVQAYGLTAAALGLAEKVIHTRRKPNVKYRNPITGETWSGRGKLPNWIKESGKPKEEFAVFNK